MKHDPRSVIDRVSHRADRFPPTAADISEAVLRKTLEKLDPNVVRAPRANVTGQGRHGWFTHADSARSSKAPGRLSPDRRPLLWILLALMVVGTVFAMVYLHVNGGSKEPKGSGSLPPESSLPSD